MAASAHSTGEQQDGPIDAHGLDELVRAGAAIVAEARARVAAGGAPDVDALAARLRAVAGRARSRGGGGGEAAAIDAAERTALDQLDRVTAVHRARLLLARSPEPAPPPPARAATSLRSALRTRPTITGNMDVRRTGGDGTLTLAWQTAAGISEWEVRISERPDARSDYELRDTLALPASAETVDVPLGELPLRVHLFGRGRDGRLVRRAIISGLTRETWNDRWQRRASAS